MVHVMLFPMTKVQYFHISTFRSIPAVAIMNVFCISLVSCCLATLFRNFVNDFYMTPVVPIVICIALYLNSTCAIILYKDHNILRTFRLLSRLYFYVLILQYILTDKFFMEEDITKKVYFFKTTNISKLKPYFRKIFSSM